MSAQSEVLDTVGQRLIQARAVLAALANSMEPGTMVDRSQANLVWAASELLDQADAAIESLDDEVGGDGPDGGETLPAARAPSLAIVRAA